MRASVAVPYDYDLAAIAKAAGNADWQDRAYNLETGRLYVSGVSQEALEAAAARPEFRVVAPPVPASVPLWRARAALAEAGLIGAVNEAVAGLGGAVEQWWEYGVEVERSNARLAQIAGALGLTDAQIDDLFRRAAVIEP